MVDLWPRVPHVHHRLRDWQHGPASCGPSHVTKCLGKTITDAFESSRQQRIITQVQTLKAREPKRWKIETSSCLQTLQDGSNFQASGSSNASGGCGEQQTSTSPVLPFFFAPQNKSFFFFWLVAAWVKSRAERPSVSGVNRQLHVQIGCRLRIRNRKDELTKQAKRNKLQIKPEGN